MAATRNFDLEIKDHNTPVGDGPTFILGGETFHCVALPPGGVMSRLTGTGTNVATFIEDCLLEFRAVASLNGDEPMDAVVEKTDDVERWRKLMADKERPIPVELLVDVVIYLSKEYGERPTVRSRR